jgi:DNA-binding CsgD family transcriptional regulator/PAS domain-containing protein
MHMVERDGAFVRELSDVIGAIYDCALDPQLWPDACRAVAALCESSAGGICIHDLHHLRNDQLFVFGYPVQFLQALEARYAGSPMAAADVVSNLGDVRSLSMQWPEVVDSSFFSDVLQPFGIQDILWFPALRTGGRMASLHASRSEKIEHYQTREIDLFKLLSPHVCRALAISDVLDIKTLKSEMLEQTLDALVTGVYLTARDGRVVYMNATAEQQVRRGRGVQLVNDRLAPTDPATRAALGRVIERAGHGSLDMGLSSHTMAIPDARGAGYVATCLPVESGQRSAAVAPFAATCAVFVQDPVQAPLMPGEAFARLHGLTGGELRVLLALAEGQSGKEAAVALGIGEATLRSHLQRIFAKTGATRQAELLQLFRNAAPPVR